MTRSCVQFCPCWFECALDKEKDFAASANLLGVTVGLSDPSLSKVCVGNKLERCAEVSAAVDEVIQKGASKAREVASLFGRIQFMEGQIMGRPSCIHGAPCIVRFRWKPFLRRG